MALYCRRWRLEVCLRDLKTTMGNRDSATRRATRLAVQFDVGELGFVL